MTGVSTRVQWSDKIANSARSWGQQLANQGCGFYHSSSPYGENLAKGYSSIQAVMGGWVTSEARCWSASNPNSCSGCVCGHFTQVRQSLIAVAVHPRRSPIPRFCGNLPATLDVQQFVAVLGSQFMFANMQGYALFCFVLFCFVLFCCCCYNF